MNSKANVYRVPRPRHVCMSSPTHKYLRLPSPSNSPSESVDSWLSWRYLVTSRDRQQVAEDVVAVVLKLGWYLALRSSYL